MRYDEIVKSEDYLINLGRFIEKLNVALKHHKSWKDVSNMEERFNADGDGDDLTVIIELVPVWADLESLEGRDALELFNEYYDTDYKDDSQVNWYDMDIKIRVLDNIARTDFTASVYYFDNNELKKLY